jgi:hypothetical protein
MLAIRCITIRMAALNASMPVAVSDQSREPYGYYLTLDGFPRGRTCRPGSRRPRRPPAFFARTFSLLASLGTPENAQAAGGSGWGKIRSSRSIGSTRTLRHSPLETAACSGISCRVVGPAPSPNPKGIP